MAKKSQRKPLRGSKPPLGARLKPMHQRTFVLQWRNVRRMSQEQLADKVGEYLSQRGLAKGYTHASIQRLETSKIGAKLSVMSAIANALGVTVGELMSVDPSAPGFDLDAHEKKMKSDAKEMDQIWQSASESDRQKIVQISRTIIGTGTGG